jgi:predicted transcriptional regulator
MKPPCELAVKEFLPSLRAAIVRELSEVYHMKQIDIAEALGITQASVSQYLNDERAKENRFTVINGFTEAVKKIAGTIALKNVSKAAVLPLMCEVCSQVRSSQEFCQVHQDMLMDGECNICRQEKEPLCG